MPEKRDDDKDGDNDRKGMGEGGGAMTEQGRLSKSGR